MYACFNSCDIHAEIRGKERGYAVVFKGGGAGVSTTHVGGGPPRIFQIFSLVIFFSEAEEAHSRLYQDNNLTNLLFTLALRRTLSEFPQTWFANLFSSHRIFTITVFFALLLLLLLRRIFPHSVSVFLLFALSFFFCFTQSRLDLSV